jgi:hypothetical protein
MGAAPGAQFQGPLFIAVRYRVFVPRLSVCQTFVSGDSHCRSSFSAPMTQLYASRGSR